MARAPTYAKKQSPQKKRGQKKSAAKKAPVKKTPKSKKPSTKSKVRTYQKTVDAFVDNYVPPPDGNRSHGTKKQKFNWPGNQDPDIARDALASTIDPYSKIRLLAMWGMKTEHIALIFDTTPDLLSSRLSADEELRQAYDKGRAEGIANMAGALYINGITGNASAQMFFLSRQAGWHEPIVVEGGISVEHGLKQAVEKFNNEILPHIGEEIVKKATKDSRQLDS